MLEMDHEIGKSTSPPKLLKVTDYPTWKERFENYLKFTDIRMWMCIYEGYVAPTVEFEGSKRVPTFANMKEDDRKMYEAEHKAHSAITMCLPMEILHTFKSYRTSKELWEALERRFQGNTQVRESRIELLKTQFMVFKYMKDENLDDLINRFYHLMTELDSNCVTFTDIEKRNKLLNSLPPKWDLYAVMIKENSEYSNWTLEDVIGKLRAYDMGMQQKETNADFVQNPSLYHGKKVSSTVSSTGGVTAFFSGEADSLDEQNDAEGNYAFVATGDSGKSRVPQIGNNGNRIKAMPMSVKSAEDHLALLASFVASYENYIQGKASDPALLDEDYEQLDPNDLEEMDLQWQLAMLSLRTKRLINRTGKKFVGGKTGFDKTKVKCYNCQGFGHFARECQRPKQFDNNSSGRTNFSYSSNSNTQSPGNTSNSRALVVQQDGSYDWNNCVDKPAPETKALMAEITEDSVLSEELIQIISEDDHVSTNQKQENSERESEPKVADTTRECSNVRNAEKEIFNLELDVGSSLEEAIAYMADLEAPTNQQVILDLNLIINICRACDKMSSKVKNLVEVNDSLNKQVLNYNQLKEENIFLNSKISDYKTQSKADNEDLKVLSCKVNEQIQIIDMARDTVAEKTREIASKQTELAEAQVKIVELNRKLDQFQNSKFILNHVLSTQKQANDVTGLGYNEVPPPFNDNYTFAKTDGIKFVKSTGSEQSSQSDKIPETEKSKESVTAKPAKSEISQDVKVTSVLKKSPEVTDRTGSVSITNSQNISPSKTLKKVQFVEEKNSKLKNKVVEDERSESHASNFDSSDKSNAKDIPTKKQLSCFICREKGHVASICPNKKDKATSKSSRKGSSPQKLHRTNQPSPPKPSVSSSTSVPTTSIGNQGKTGLGYSEKTQFSRTQPRSYPRSTTPNRSFTPNRPQTTYQRSQTPSRTSTPNRSTSTNKFSDYRPSYNTNYQRPLNQRVTDSSTPKSTVNSQKPKTPSDGYLREFKFVDENGRPKTVMAWVPHDN